MTGSNEEAIACLDKYSVPEPNTGCVLWMVGADKNGYGKIAFNSKDWRAHRLSYHLLKGPVLSGDLVCHKCDTPACINPDHLFIGTPLSNMQDKVKKGRLKNQNAAKTHCRHGHEFTSDNIRWSKTAIDTPKRSCLICYTARYKARNLAKKKS